MRKVGPAFLIGLVACFIAECARADEAVPPPSAVAANRTMAALAVIEGSALVRPDTGLLVQTARDAIRKAAADPAAFDACAGAIAVPGGPMRYPASYAPVRNAFACLAAASAEQVNAAADQAVTAAMARFDPFGRWFGAKELEALFKPGASIGITLKQAGAGIVVLSLPANGPAYIGGVRRGDRILAIDGKPVAPDAIDSVMAAIRGPVGSQLTLRVRHADDRVENLVLTRRTMTPQDYGVDVDRQGPVLRVGVLQMTAGITRQVRAAIAAQTRSVGVLVLDLRDNSGGLLDESIALADAFLTIREEK
jgi:hypothetical protein